VKGHHISETAIKEWTGTQLGPKAKRRGGDAVELLAEKTVNERDGP
jgi:hypothetical protein